MRYEFCTAAASFTGNHLFRQGGFWAGMYEYAQIQRKYPADTGNNSFIIHDFCTFVTINFWRRNFAAKNRDIWENILGWAENLLQEPGIYGIINKLILQQYRRGHNRADSKSLRRRGGWKATKPRPVRICGHPGEHGASETLTECLSFPSNNWIWRCTQVVEGSALEMR